MGVNNGSFFLVIDQDRPSRSQSRIKFASSFLTQVYFVPLLNLVKLPVIFILLVINVGACRLVCVRLCVYMTLCVCPLFVVIMFDLANWYLWLTAPLGPPRGSYLSISLC